jgi:hypothetical protein
MVELIITESGFPKNRETLELFQTSFKKPLELLLNQLPGRRVLEGFVITAGEGLNITITEGIIVWQGKLWTVEPYAGEKEIILSFFEETITASFNIGTQGSPIYSDRPHQVRRYAQAGVVAGNIGTALMSDFFRGRRVLEYLLTGSLFVGAIVIDSETAIYNVIFPSIETNDYQVIGNFRSAVADVEFSQAFTWDINNRTANGFDVYVQTVTANSINLIFDWTIIPINRVNAVDVIS